MSRARAALLFVALAACAASIACARPELEPPTSPLLALPSSPPDLSPEGRRAYDVLRRAETFDTPHVGVSGALSGHVAAFRVVLREPRAREAFLALLGDATAAGRLYALAGAYFAAPEVFDEAVRWLETSRASVRTVSGCILDERTVTSIVRQPNGIRVPAGKTLDDVTTVATVDVAGGWIPLTFASDDAVPAPRGPAR